LKLTKTCLLTLLLLPFAASAAARDDLLNSYATAAKVASSAYSGCSPARGEKLHNTQFSTGKPETPSCTTCHGANPRLAGRTPSGKLIDPLAASLSPTRFSDPLKVEKWFRRNCIEVLGRECTPLEKGDWLSAMISR
jgi:cytochrome c553